MTRNKKYMNTKTTLTFQFIQSLDKKNHTNTLVKAEKSTTLKRIVMSTLEAHKANEAPKIRVAFTKMLHTTFSNDTSACPFITARTLADRTDTPVPKATMVPPMTAWSTCMNKAMEEAESTRKYEATTTTAPPKKANDRRFFSPGLG